MIDRDTKNLIELLKNTIDWLGGERDRLAGALRKLREEIPGEVKADMDWRRTGEAREALYKIIDVALDPSLEGDEE